ncbi:MAG: hypothetical protein VYB54_08125 [Pseudomonadota bacterium]|nr:hypothetical protein [Pseudomonadota bacterium]
MKRVLALLLLVLLPLFAQAAVSGAEETVRVRFGDHDEFSRAVFDWTGEVDYRISESDSGVEIRFGQPARFDLKDFTRMRPKAITGVRALDDGQTVRIETDGRQEARVFRSGNRVVLDLRPARSAPATAATPPQAVRKDAPAAPVRAEAPKPEAKPAAARPARPAEAPKPVAAAKPAPVAAKPAPVAAKSAPVPAKPAAAADTKAGTPVDPNAVPVVADLRPGRTILRFRWPERVGAAALHRGEHVWVAFESDRRVDPGDARQLDQGPVVAVVPEPSSVGSVVRIDVAIGAALALTVDGNDWVVDIGGARGRAETAISFESQATSASGPRIFAPVAEAGQPILINDPVVGDRIALVPMREAGLGVRPERRYVLFELPDTPQGVAVRFRGEDLDVVVDATGLAIGGRRTLHLSAEASRLPSVATPPDLDAQTPQTGSEHLLDMAAWAGEGDPETIRQDLLYRVAMASATARNGERLAMARFLVSQGLAPEALGVMARIEAEDRHVDTDPGYRALRGVARLLAGHLGEAAGDLRHPTLADAGDVSLFRGLLAVKRREFDEARREFVEGVASLEKLPEEMRPEIRMAIAETALALRDPDFAQEQVGLLLEHPGTAARREEARLLAARISAMTGETDAALELFAQLSDSIQRPVRARARFAQANILLDEERIALPEAIERMERLRFSWRGDVFEFDLMRRLGELYIRNGDYRKGLVTMRETVERFPDLPEAQKLAGGMNDIFASLFEGDEAETMSPVTAMGLYYDFRELTPDGARGDRMIRRLADRLAAVELLDEAAKLLEHQVTHRLQGEEKARVGARLAVLYLLDGKPKEAIEALRVTRSLSLADDLNRERLLLEARALTDIGRYDRAMIMLSGLEGEEVEGVRTEILWRARQWSRAAQSLAPRLVELRPENRPLDQEARRDILRYAIASSLAGDQPALTRLRNDFGERMNGQPEWPAFQVVTAEDSRDSAEFRNLAAEIAQVDRFEAFMSAYRDRLRSTPLSAIN